MTKIIAHRGFSSKKLENTLESFKMAYENEFISGVELDIRMTLDKKIVCIHDGHFKSKKKYVRELNYSDMSSKIKNKDFFINLFKYSKDIRSFKNLLRTIKYMVKKGNVPLLDDVLKITPNDSKVYIEIKGSQEEYEGDTYVSEIIKVLDEHKNKNLYIMSFNKDIVLKIKKLRKNFKYGILINKNAEDINLNVDFISIKSSKLNYKLAKKIIEDKKELVVWTINTYSDYLFLKSHVKEFLKDISITTDYPDLIFHLLKKVSRRY